MTAKTRRTLGYVALGVGGAGLAVGGVALGLALGKKASIDESGNCEDNQCRRSETELVDSYMTWRTVSTVGFIGGAVVAAVGIGLVLTAPKQAQDTALVLGPGSVTLRRAF